MIRGLLASFALAALAACQTGGATVSVGSDDPGYRYVPVAGPLATPAERAACDAVGGEIRPAGLLGNERCVQTYADAGTACTDTSECIGRCLNAGEFVDGPVATGQCERDDSPFGCDQEVIGGIGQPPLCID